MGISRKQFALGAMVLLLVVVLVRYLATTMPASRVPSDVAADAAVEQELAMRDALMEQERAQIEQESAQVRQMELAMERELAARRERAAQQASAAHATRTPGVRGSVVASLPLPPSAPPPALIRTVAEDESSAGQLLQRLGEGNVAFNTPSQMNVHETRTIQLLLSPKESIGDLEQKITDDGARAGLSIRISQLMRARLVGNGFDIRAIDSEQQWIPQDGTTEWRWDITPTSAGTHELHLTLDAIVTVGGASASHSIRVFDRTIKVEVTLLQQAGGFAQRNWQWLWAAIVVPVLGLVGAWWRRRRPKAEPA